jgi:hypothetical protein
MLATLKKYVRASMPPPLNRRIDEINSWRWDRKVMRSPDRAVLVNQILPAFAKQGGKILWIGCRRYTQSYPALLESHGAMCWTMDIDSTVERFGHCQRHTTASLLNADQLLPVRDFNAVLCNGVFGFGLDDVAMQRQALAVMANVLVPGGWLLVGWNADRVQDPVGLASSVPALRPQPYGSLPQRLPVAGVTHVYDFFQKA